MRPDQKNPHETPRQHVNAAFGEIARAGLPADIDSGTFAAVLARLLSALRFINARDRGLKFAAAARAAGVSAPTAWRRKRALFDGGLRAFIPGSKAEPGISASIFNRRGERQQLTLEHPVRYLLGLAAGLEPEQAAAGLPIGQAELHDSAKRLLCHGRAGLAPDWKSRTRWARELCAWKIKTTNLAEVEVLAARCGSVEKGWRRFARTPQCPWRFSIFVRKQKRLPQFLARAVQIQRIPVRALRGPSGKIFISVADRTFTLERKSRHALKN